VLAVALVAPSMSAAQDAAVARGESELGEAKALERLLAMADNDLLDLVMGRAETKDPGVRAMLEVLRAA